MEVVMNKYVGKQAYRNSAVSAPRIEDAHGAITVCLDTLLHNLKILAEGPDHTSELYGKITSKCLTAIYILQTSPNPFSPFEHNQLSGDGYVHIHASVKTSFVVKMDIYNFAMEPVLQTEFDRRQANTGSMKWNGKDKNGRLVDNGTYFIRLEYDQKTKWIKLIVIK
jgi:hypothetical protein